MENTLNRFWNGELVPMQVIRFNVQGPALLTPEVFHDNRGYFVETYNRGKMDSLGISEAMWEQDNQSYSHKNVLRGLHFQYPTWQAKLVRVSQGKIFDLIVDLRRSSSTFGQHIAVELDSSSNCVFYVPEGFAHGFSVLSDDAVVNYKVSTLFVPEESYTLNWNDSTLMLEKIWPVKNPILSEKDAKGMSFAEILNLL